MGAEREANPLLKAAGDLLGREAFPRQLQVLLSLIQHALIDGRPQLHLRQHGNPVSVIRAVFRTEEFSVIEHGVGTYACSFVCNGSGPFDAFEVGSRDRQYGFPTPTSATGCPAIAKDAICRKEYPSRAIPSSWCVRALPSP